MFYPIIIYKSIIKEIGMFSLFKIFKAIFMGFFTGFIASIPLGPSGLESVNRSISHGFKSGLKVSLGAVCADITYIVIINLGIFNVFNKHHRFEGLFWIISGIVLMIFSRISARPKNSDSKFKKSLNKYTENGFWAGYLITFLNPTTPSLWIALSGTVLSLWRIRGRMFFMFSILSMIIGSITWFCLLNILASKGFKALKSDYTKNTSNLLNYFLLILGAIFILWGVYKFIF